MFTSKGIQRVYHCRLASAKGSKSLSSPPVLAGFFLFLDISVWDETGYAIFASNE